MLKKPLFLTFLLLHLSFAQSSIFDSLSITQYLPKDTLFFLAANNPESLLNRLGREELIQKYRSFYDMAVAEMTQALGHNLFEMNTLRQLGLDPSGSCGFVFIEERPEIISLFFSLNDRQKAQENLVAFSQQFGFPLQVKSLGDAILLDPIDQQDKKFFYLIRGGYLFFFGLARYSYNYDDQGNYRERTPEEIERFIQQTILHLTQLPPQDSLAQDSVYQRLSSKIAFGPDAGFYINMRRVAELAIKDASRVYTGNLDYYEKQIQDLRNALEEQKGDPQSIEENLKYYEAELARQKEWIKQSKRRAEREAQTMEAILGGFEGIIVGASLQSNFIQARSSVAFNQQNLFVSFLRNSSTPSLLIETLQNQPLALLQGSISPTQLLSVLSETVFKAQGIPLNQIRDVFKREFKVDLDQELLPLFTGEAGIALTQTVQAHSTNFEKMFQNFSVSATLTLSSGSKAEQYLDQILAHPELTRMIKKNQWNGVTLPTPWKPIHLAILRDHLVITTETSFLDHIQSGVKDSFVTRLQNKELQKTLQAPNFAIKGMLDFHLISSFILGVNQKFSKASATKSAESAIASESVDGVPYSEAYLQKKQEIETVQQQIEDLQKKLENLYKEISTLDEERSSKQAELSFKMFENFGIFAISARVESLEIVIDGGHFLENIEFKTLISQTIDNVMRMESLYQEYRPKTSAIYETINAVQQQNNELWNKKYLLESELAQIRRQDIEAYHQEKE